MAKFFGVTPQQREQMKNKDNPDFKKKSKSSITDIIMEQIAIQVFNPAELVFAILEEANILLITPLNPFKTKTPI